MRPTMILILGLLLMGTNLALAVSQDERTEEPSAQTEKEMEIEYLQKRLQKLTAEERELESESAPKEVLDKVREQMMRIERALKKIDANQQTRRPEFRQEVGQLEAAARRIQYIRAAAESLKKAGLDDLAGQLMSAAEDMERQVREAKENLGAEMKRNQARQEGQGLAGVVNELREEVQRLRDEVQALRQEVKQR